jgi:hypothetical protein
MSGRYIVLSSRAPRFFDITAECPVPTRPVACHLGDMGVLEIKAYHDHVIAIGESREIAEGT